MLCLKERQKKDQPEYITLLVLWLLRLVVAFVRLLAELKQKNERGS